MSKYTLINPYILGTMKTSISANDENEAAKKIWEIFARHATNDVPKFYFTIKQKGGSLFHFVVSEDINNDDKNDVNFSIKKINIDNKNEKNILKHIKKIKSISQTGGHHHHRYENFDDDDSSSSDEYDNLIFRKMIKKLRLKNQIQQSPINYMLYNPIMYDGNDIYIPNFLFNGFVPPYIHIMTQPTSITL